MFKNIKEEWNHYKLCCSMDQENAHVFGFAHLWLVETIKIMICKYKGHDWEDNSWGGPESGGIDISCKRCGENYHEIFY